MSDGVLPDFDGETWVAFSDLCGLKAMYRKDPDKAAEALDCFYETVYETHQRCRLMTALAVSDCAVFWLSHSRDGGGDKIAPNELKGLLERLQFFHREMAGRNLLVNSTLAYGRFRYERRTELPRLRKNMIAGGAYMKAFAANEKVREGAIVTLKESGRRNTSADRGDVHHVRTKTQVKRCSGSFSRFIADCKEVDGCEFLWWLDHPTQARDEMTRVEQAVESRYRELLRVYNGRGE